MAEVYRGHDIALEREVAVKVLPAALALDSGYVERFREEAKRVALLSHPHIVPVYAFGEQDGLLYLVMPIMRESLRDRMTREGVLPINESARLVVQIAAALDAAHAQGIVHRDVKPENILLDTDGKAHLTDFGIARDMDFLRQTGTNRTLAATGLPVGTPEYMAPEQLRATPVDQRADIYALGAVLYELLTGRAPHEAATPYEVAALVLTSPITPPAERNPAIWPALNDVVMVALSAEAGQRYPDMRRFAMALRRSVLEKDAGIAKLTMPARTLTGIPAMAAVAQAVGLSESRARKPAAAVAEWPARPRTGPLGDLPARPQASSSGGGKKALLIAALVVVALVGIVGGSGLALINSFGGGGRAGNNGGGVPIVGSGPGASATNTAVAATQVAIDIAATSTAEGAPTPTPYPTATSTITPNPTATSTPALASPLTFPSFTISHSTCYGQQTITNTSNQTVGWNWVSVQPGMPPKSKWSLNFQDPQTFPPLPSDSEPGISPSQHDTLSIIISGCKQGQPPFTVYVQDTLGNSYNAFTIIVK